MVPARRARCWRCSTSGTGRRHRRRTRSCPRQRLPPRGRHRAPGPGRTDPRVLRPVGAVQAMELLPPTLGQPHCPRRSGGKVRFIHEANSASNRADLLAACLEGGVSVLVGSTMRMGVGLNVQDRIIGDYEVTLGWNPDISHQARGRAERQGNQNESFGRERSTSRTAAQRPAAMLARRRVSRGSVGPITATRTRPVPERSVRPAMPSAAFAGPLTCAFADLHSDRSLPPSPHGPA